MFRMSTELINIFVDTHNQLRNDIALGRVAPFAQASRMQTVVCLKYFNIF